jgi:ribosomal protein S18 acetylase RimI-like enzyme
VVSILQIDHRDTATSAAICTLTELAYTQEANVLGVSALLSQSRTAEDFRASEDFFLGAYLERELIGLLSISRDDEPQHLCISLLVVRPGMQQRSVGTLLVREALARGDGVPFVVAVAANNAPALALYSRLGFAPYRDGVMGPNALPVVKLKSAA